MNIEKLLNKFKTEFKKDDNVFFIHTKGNEVYYYMNGETVNISKAFSDFATKNERAEMILRQTFQFYVLLTNKIKQ